MTLFLRFFLLFLALSSLSALAAARSPLPTEPSAAASSIKEASVPAPVVKGSNKTKTDAPANTTPIILPENPYSVKNVKVDVNAESSVKARDKAFMSGGRAAFIALARQLTGDAGFDAKSVDDPSLSKMIKSFEVETERASGTRYIATLTFNFKQQEVSNVLEGAGKTINEDPYNGTQGHEPTTAVTMPPVQDSKIVLLPLLRLPARNVLWEEKTPWHKAWDNFMSDHPRGDIALPEGNMEDIGSISATEALSGMRPALQRIMNRYQAQGLVVAALSASTTDITPDQGMNVQIARFDHQGIMMGTATLSVNPNPKKRAMEWLQDAAAASLGSMEEISLRSQKLNATADPNAVRVATLPEGYNGPVVRVNVNVPFNAMEEWASRRTIIERIPNLAALEVLRMNRNRALIQIDYAGPQEALDAALAQRGMKIVPAPEGDGNLMVLLAPASQPSAPQAPVADQMPHSTQPQAQPPAPPSSPQFQTIYVPVQQQGSGTTPPASEDMDGNEQ